MKLLFVITSSDKSAKGGHFRSCLTIAKAMRRGGAKVKILNIGLVSSPVFSQDFVEVEFININVFNGTIKFFNILREIILTKKETRVLAFDFFAFFIVRIGCLLSKNPFGYFRCGGPNLDYFPVSKWIFCFSKESYTFFTNRFSKSVVYLYPNRIEKRCTFSNGELRAIVKNDFPIVLRIGRLVSNYYPINLASLKLSRLLNEMRILHNMVFIGYPDDFDSIEFARFKEECDSMPNVWLLTEIQHTENAAYFLNEASLVIGTGRGAMEAIVENRVVAVFSDSHELPVLVESSEVFEHSLNFNFSLRNRIAFVNEDTNLKNIVELFNNRIYPVKVGDFLQSRRKQLDIDEVIDDYLRAFEDMSYDSEFNFYDLYKHFSKMFFPKLLLLR